MTQTDDLLSKLYDQLRNTGDSFSMVYFSDHGLAFKERGKEVQYLAHDDKFQQNFQVPFMVLSSDDKTHRVIKARRSANDFLQFFSQWTGITAEQIKTAYPFVSNKKAPQCTLPTSSYRKLTTTIWVRIFSILRVRPSRAD
jgi:glucan phosphoethanolaminetransferase (alkaline phosphatase superfamily)